MGKQSHASGVRLSTTKSLLQVQIAATQQRDQRAIHGNPTHNLLSMMNKNSDCIQLFQIDVVIVSHFKVQDTRH